MANAYYVLYHLKYTNLCKDYPLLSLVSEYNLLLSKYVQSQATIYKIFYLWELHAGNAYFCGDVIQSLPPPSGRTNTKVLLVRSLQNGSS